MALIGELSILFSQGLTQAGLASAAEGSITGAHRLAHSLTGRGPLEESGNVLGAPADWSLRSDSRGAIQTLERLNQNGLINNAITFERRKPQSLTISHRLAESLGTHEWYNLFIYQESEFVGVNYGPQLLIFLKDPKI